MPGKMARSDPRPSVRVTRGAGSIQHLASVLQEGRENANIDAGLGFHLENLSSEQFLVPLISALDTFCMPLRRPELQRRLPRKVCVSQRPKIDLAIIGDQAHNSSFSKLEATPARTHGEAAGWVPLPLSDRFYTPTLIRPDNERRAAV